MVKKMLIGLGGFLLGLACGDMVNNAKVKAAKKSRDDIRRECNDLRAEVAHLRQERMVRQVEETVKEVSKPEKDVEPETESKFHSEAILIGDDDDDPENEDDDIPPFGYASLYRAKTTKLIDEKTWNENAPFMTSNVLIYYQQDGTLVNEDKEIVIDEATIVGEEVMDIIDDTKNDYLYAMNTDTEQLYAITIEHDASYLRDVLGE